MNRSPQLPHIAHSSRLEAPHKKVLHVSASSTLHMGTPIPISCTWGHLKIRRWYCSQTHNRPKQFTVKGDKNLLVPDVIWDANYPTFSTKSSKAVAFTQSCVRSCDRPTGWAQVPLVPIQTYFRQAFLRDGIAPKAFLHPDLYTLRCAAALPGSLSHPPSYRQMQDWLDNICSSANPTGCFLSLHWLLGMYSLIIFYSNAFPRKWWGWLLFYNLRSTFLSSLRTEIISAPQSCLLSFVPSGEYVQFNYVLPRLFFPSSVLCLAISVSQLFLLEKTEAKTH